MPDLTRRLARLRVPLGFAFALFVFLLARPTPASMAWGLGVALVGEAIRLWAAGHVEKGREVTSSGPYQWTRHPLYVGSTVMGVGLAIVCNSAIVAALILTYLAVTLTAAVRTEEAWLRATFGSQYNAYCAGQTVRRRFSLSRAMRRNREYRTLGGLLLAALLLALKMS